MSSDVMHAALLLRTYRHYDGCHDSKCLAVEQALVAVGLDEDAANDLIATFESMLDQQAPEAITSAALAALHRSSEEEALEEARQARALNRTKEPT